MEQSTSVRTTNDIVKDIKAKLEEFSHPHKRFFLFGIKKYGRPARKGIRELRPLITEYYKLSLQEEKNINKFE